MPTRNQLKETIAGGNDNHHNSLVIDINGMFKLIPLIDKSPSELQSYPVRFETFQAGNGYVGYLASMDETFIEQTYKALLEDWWLHLDTGRYLYSHYSSEEYTQSQLMNNILTKFEKQGRL